MRYKLSELDVVFLSYDNNQEENWHRVLNFRPDAKRLHRVKGFDKAHKLCAELSTTSRLIIVDGDNWLHDNYILGDQDKLFIDDTGRETACFSFGSVNNINGLVYGNGGIKVWDKATLLNTNTHENGNSTDFCWDVPYYQDNRILSITQHQMDYVAWRSGYREAVKMTQHEGKPRDLLEHTWYAIHDKNLSRLNVWLTVGRDVKNGIWAILGARQALCELMSSQLDQQNINDYDWFETMWDGVWDKLNGFGPEKLAHDYGNILINQFNFYVPELDAKQSSWFKRTYINPTRQGFMK